LKGLRFQGRALVVRRRVERVSVVIVSVEGIAKEGKKGEGVCREDVERVTVLQDEEEDAFPKVRGKVFMSYIAHTTISTWTNALKRLAGR